MKSFISENDCSNEYEEDCMYAVINVSDDLIKTIKDRRKSFLALKEHDHYLSELVFRDNTPDFMKHAQLFEIFPDEEDFEALEERPHPIDASKAELDSVAYCEMVVDEDGIEWRCLPKYGRSLVETQKILYDALGISTE